MLDDRIAIRLAVTRHQGIAMNRAILLLLSLVALCVAALVGCAIESPTGTSSAPRADSCIRVPSESIASWWRFDERGDTVWAIDDPAGRNHGVRRNGAACAMGAFGSVALSLDGVDDYVDVSDAPMLDVSAGDGLGFSFWIRLPAGIPEGLVTIIDKRADGAAPTGYSVYLHHGEIGVQIADGARFVNFDGPTLPADVTSRWAFIAVSIDRGATPSLLWTLDTVSYTVVAPSMPKGALSNDARLRIGAHSLAPSTSAFFHGIIDELAIYCGEIPEGLQSQVRTAPLCR
jgi:hypothetical protein